MDGAAGIAAGLHPDQLARVLPQLDASLLGRVATSVRAHPRLDAVLERRLALPALPPGGPADALQRACLRPASVLYDIARMGGAAWHGAELRRIVDAAEIVRLTEGLGAAAHRFALRRAEFAVGPGGQVAAEEAIAKAGRVGMQLLAVMLRMLPAAYARRAALRLPPVIMELPAPDGADEAHAMRVLQAAAAEVLRDG